MDKPIARVMLCFIAALALAACDEDTASLGIHDQADEIKTSAVTYQFTTRSVLLGPVSANSTRCYLGAVHDPETDTDIKAEFIAQFHTFEDYTLPNEDRLVKDSNGDISCDSIDLRLYFTSYYGKATNPMKVYVYELDTANVVSEAQKYKTDLQLESYLPAGAQPVAKKVFTVTDYTMSDDERNSSSYVSNVRIKLPREMGTRMMKQAYENPNFFSDSYQFMHHVCAGFLFKLQSGEGTMLTLDVSTMNIYFRYQDTDADTTYTAIARFAATPEVIQSTRFENGDLSSLISASQPYTYLKTPAGIATEVAFPVDEIFTGHDNDSISRAQVVLTRLNSTSTVGTPLGTPQTLLIVHKPYFSDFFENRDVADARRSYTTSFDSSFNTFTFPNLSRMLSYMHQLKQNGMKDEGLTSDEWNAAHPDWNKAIITPVNTTSVTTSSGYSMQVSVTHDLSLSSIRLQGGTQPLQMQVIYSGYK